jgi:hypothetical protein
MAPHGFHLKIRQGRAETLSTCIYFPILENQPIRLNSRYILKNQDQKHTCSSESVHQIRKAFESLENVSHRLKDGHVPLLKRIPFSKTSSELQID